MFGATSGTCAEPFPSALSPGVECPAMIGTRPALRRTAWIALAAFLLPVLASGAHAPSGSRSPDLHLDFCTAAAPGGAPSGSLPAQPDKDSKVSTHCQEYCGCAGGSAVLAAPCAPWLAVVPGAAPTVTTVPPATTTIDVAAASPRGPPLRA